MIADIVVIAIMALCVFLGYYRGLIHVAVRLLGFVVALIVALVLYTPVSNYIIENTNAVASIQGVVQNKLYKPEEKQEENTIQNDNFVSQMEKYIGDKTDEFKANTSEVVSREVAIAVVRGLTWIGLFIGIRIIMLFIKALASVIEKIPIIKQFNKAGGTIYGILEGFAIIYAALAIINLTAPMIKENKVVEQIEDSHICKIMYENNLLLKLIL